MGLVGACVFAGNNTKWKGNSYRVNGQVIGFEKLNEKLNPVRKAVAKRPDLNEYTIKPLDPSKPEFQVLCATADKIGATPKDTWSPGDPTIPMPGKMQYEYRTTLDGAWLTRKDSTAVFEAAAKGLKSYYPGSQALEFFNVHDDADDTSGTKADSLKSFMEQMGKLNNGLDFFAYAGHGNGGSLGSACLSRTSAPQYRDFINTLRRVLKPNATIIFYACLTGVESGFAQSVSSELPNVTVFAHRSKGHGQTNPEKVRIYNNNRETFEKLLGADYWRWVTAIKSGGDLWRRYPFMTMDELKAEVQGYAATEPPAKSKKKAA
jgi:hypothetical protein